MSAELLQIGVAFVLQIEVKQGLLQIRVTFIIRNWGKFITLEQVLQIEAIIKISLLQIEACNVMRDISRLKVKFCVTRAYKYWITIIN